MGKVEASVEIAAPLAEVWDLYFDRDRWPSWVDGFSSVASESGYPEVGGTLSWRSTPAGRGTVQERVSAHEPRSLHRIDYSDPESSGTLEVAFEMLPASDAESGRRTRVTQRLTYAIKTGGPLRWLLDVLFVRSQMRRSLERSLIELRLEAERAGGTQAG
ncbi:MAG: SRPBCC family protein [Solirubrobacterales bacterium]|nr:SRPBCC family protein [Solirubrobacterales bacterium]